MNLKDFHDVSKINKFVESICSKTGLLLSRKKLGQFLWMDRENAENMTLVITSDPNYFQDVLRSQPFDSLRFFEAPIDSHVLQQKGWCVDVYWIVYLTKSWEIVVYVPNHLNLMAYEEYLDFYKGNSDTLSDDD